MKFTLNVDNDIFCDIANSLFNMIYKKSHSKKKNKIFFLFLGIHLL